MAQKAIHVNLAPTDPKNIAAGDDAAILSGIIGSALASSSGILAFGERLNLSKVTDNSVKVSSGIYLNQGHAVRVTSDEVLTVLSGTQGKQRIDLIVSEYRKGSERDTHVIKTIQGSLFDADPEAPSLQAENLHGAGTVRQEEIGRIVFNGTSIASVAKTAKTISGLVELTDSITDHNHDTKYLGKTAKAADSEKLDGKDSTEFAPAGHNHDTKYLGKTDTATDSIRLGGYSDRSYMVYLAKDSPPTYDLNNLLTPGHYGTGGSPAFANGPAGRSGSYCHLIVIGRTSTVITQILIDSTGLIYSRLYVNSAWSPWTTLTGALYGTGSPPSSLAPGQIYIQY